MTQTKDVKPNLRGQSNFSKVQFQFYGAREKITRLLFSTHFKSDTRSSSLLIPDVLCGVFYQEMLHNFTYRVTICDFYSDENFIFFSLISHDYFNTNVKYIFNKFK